MEPLLIKFIQARNYTPHQGLRQIDLIVLHSMESGEKPDTAENVAAWFAGETAPQASAHYCVDNDSIVQCVKDQDIAWAAPGANRNGIHIEHAGKASQSAEEWNDEYSRNVIVMSAGLSSILCKKYDIPVRFLTAEDLVRNGRGITTHAEVSKAFHQSDHWDPGPGFPTSTYIYLVSSIKSVYEPAS